MLARALSPCALILAACGSSSAPSEAPAPTPPAPAAFIRWSDYGKLTLPVDADHDGAVDEIPASDLDRYSSRYFYSTTAGQITAAGYVAGNGESVFWAPVDGGATTANAKYVRSEMREQIKLGDNHTNWPLAGRHIQSGTLRITSLPKPRTAGDSAKTVFAQIHALDKNPPVKLQFATRSTGTVAYAIFDLTPGGSDTEASASVPIRLGESFSYEIEVEDGILTTSINGSRLDRRDLNKSWAGETFYFKAGSYVQNGADNATGAAEVVYSSLARTHR